MPLNATIIASRLASVSRDLQDNEAQAIINTATAADLRSLDAEAVLRLYEALRMLPPLVYSSRDQAAMRRLAAETQFQPVTATPDFGVNLIKSARPGQANIQAQLNPMVISRIYSAENRRLSWYERMGIDGDTVGRGQLGEPAYLDVVDPTHFRAEFEKYITHVYIARILNAGRSPANESWLFDSTYKFQIPGSYSEVWRDQVLEDFVVAAYMAIRIENATKVGRSSRDAARFAAALYHGMRGMVVAAQTAVRDDVNWAPVEAELRRQGHVDECDYVNEVVP